MTSIFPPGPLTSPPPVYDASERPDQNNDTELPAYTSGGAISSGRVVPLNFSPLDLTEHVERYLTDAGAPLPKREYTYELVKGKEKDRKKPWAFLTVLGDSTVSLSKGIPTIVEGEKVEGEVKIDLDSAEACQAVIVSVRGQIIGGAQNSDVLTFLELPKVLWSASPNPLSSTSKAANLLPGPKQKSNKLQQGSHSWPFSIDLPKEVALTVGPKDAPKVEVYRLPQSFFERHARARVHYEVTVRFVRGLLKTDWRLSTQFAYVPITISPSPSPLRVLAYQENTPLLGPEADPTGWVTLDPVAIYGRTETKEVDIRIILSIASPLSYARGSVIPLVLTVQCKDARALEQLSTPRSIVLRLRRRLRYHSDDHKPPESYPWTDEHEHSELALWWPETLTRYLKGEIHLQTDWKPTTVMPRFRVEYSVVLLPPDVVGFQFETSSTSRGELLEQPVEITTAFAPGPRPRMYAPPQYESGFPGATVSEGRYTMNQIF
ncbi:hypothetical protein K435DRAFT_688088 [Dendrothele bispora CBS 962.96]|uniref:Arrestin-like N-terminal domain-containing protein n=1 Tax=Dendrothele bispora (strain CBS 962.96) TaxID=1314807 RepID=A0A4S8L6D1_DENBC|nr:hypothetical protein K435DRAFT_688088 [Dendrothele bispora CBS 962.96]